MPLTYGAYTACLQDRSLPEALDVLKQTRDQLQGLLLNGDA